MFTAIQSEFCVITLDFLMPYGSEYGNLLFSCNIINGVVNLGNFNYKMIILIVLCFLAARRVVALPYFFWNGS